MHDARTPLNVIVMLAELLAAGKPGSLNARQARHIESIGTAAKQIADALTAAEATQQRGPVAVGQVGICER